MGLVCWGEGAEVAQEGSGGARRDLCFHQPWAEGWEAWQLTRLRLCRPPPRGAMLQLLKEGPARAEGRLLGELIQAKTHLHLLDWLQVCVEIRRGFSLQT